MLQIQEINEIVGFLPRGRSRTILRLRLKGHTLEQIGQTYCFTRERSRQIINTAINDLPEEQAKSARAELDKICGRGSSGIKAARNKRKEARRLLKEAFAKNGFWGKGVARILKDEVAGMNDAQMRQYICDSYGLKNFGDWLRCPGCEHILYLYDKFSPNVVQRVTTGQFGPSYCRNCSSKRTIASYHRNPNVKAYALRHQKENPRRSYLHSLRWKARKDGTAIPPLPMPGLRDEDIVLPKGCRCGAGKGAGFRKFWSTISPEDKAVFVQKRAQSIAASKMAKKAS